MRGVAGQGLHHDARCICSTLPPKLGTASIAAGPPLLAATADPLIQGCYGSAHARFKQAGTFQAGSPLTRLPSACHTPSRQATDPPALCLPHSQGYVRPLHLRDHGRRGYLCPTPLYSSSCLV